MSDMVEGFRSMREARQSAKASRREKAEAEYEAAQRLAEKAGLRLAARNRGILYELHGDGWRIDFFPMNNRIRPATHTTVRAPWLAPRPIDDRISLMDLVRAAIVAEGGRR